MGKKLIKNGNKTINYNKQTDNQTNSNNEDKSARTLSRALGIPVSVIFFVAWQPLGVFRTSYEAAAKLLFLIKRRN